MDKASKIVANDQGVEVDELVELIKNAGEEFVPLNRLASYICDTPVSQVNLLDKNFQFTASKFGDWDGHITPKEGTVCQFTIEQEDILVINDTQKDERTKSIKELRENEDLRFYAGVPIKSPNGARIGAFCVIDESPKELSENQKQALIDLGKEVDVRIKLLKQKKAVELKNKKLKQAAAFLDNSTDILWVLEPMTFKIVKSEGVAPILGYSDGKVIGESLFDLIDQINIQNHIKQWINDKNNHSKLGIPVKINTESDDEIWLSLTFTKYDEHLLATGRDITKQQIAEENLKDSLEEKEILLSEVHHRVKNNLAVVSSLLQLERFKTEDEAISNLLRNTESRIISIAKIHELLYQSKDFSNVQLDSYVNELITHLQDTHQMKGRAIEVDVKITDFNINVNQALPVGLIINELITNAVKHAFPHQTSGTITVLIMEKEDNMVTVEVRDNGKGMNIDVADLKEQGNLGFTLISTLVNQLNADLSIIDNDGTRFRFSFQKSDKKGSVSAL